MFIALVVNLRVLTSMLSSAVLRTFVIERNTTQH